MRKTLLATATAKLVAGVGAVAIATGTAGAVIATQPVADHELPPQASARAVEATSDSTTTTTSTTLAPTTTTMAPTTTTTVASTTAADEQEPKDNFGAWVSAQAKDGGVDGREISAAAHERNEERKAARAAEDDDDEKDEDVDHGKRRGHEDDGD